MITKHCRNITAMEFLESPSSAKRAMWTSGPVGFDPIRSDVYDEPELYQPIPSLGNEIVMNTIRACRTISFPLPV